GERWRHSAVRYMHHVDTGHRLEQLAGHMGGGSNTTRRDIELAGIGLGISDELRNCFCWHQEIRHHKLGHACDGCDRRDVTVEIETKPFVHRSVDRVCPSDQEDRVAIRVRTNDRLGSDILATAGSVIDHEWLAESLRQLLAYQAGNDVVATPRGS